MISILKVTKVKIRLKVEAMVLFKKNYVLRRIGTILHAIHVNSIYYLK